MSMPIPGHPPRATPPALPPGWASATLGEIAAEHVRQDGPGSEPEFLYIDIGSVDNESKRIVSPRMVPLAEAPSRARQCIRRNDVLVSMTRPNLNAVAIVEAAQDGAVASTGFHVLRSGSVEPRWLYHAVQTREFVSSMCAVVQGALYPAIRPKDIMGWQCPLPPLPEQSRIADALDELFSDLDAGVAALERAKAKLKQYRASVLKAAVEGALTAAWRRDHPATEPASALLARILAERRRRWEETQLRKFKEAGKTPPKNWKAKYQAPVAPNTTGLPGLPEGWVWATIQQCSDLLQYGSSAKTCSNPTGVPVLRMGNITADGSLDTTDLKYLPADHHEFPSLLLAAGDLLFNRTNSAELVGKTGQYRGLPTPCSFASYLIRVRMLDGASPSIVSFAINGSGGRRWVKTVVTQMVGQANVNGSKLAAFAFPLAPKAEQEAIVELVEDQLSVIDHLEAEIDAKLAAAQSLRQSILRHAFTGQLVPQDPADEPASELLRRIAADRAARARAPKSVPAARRGRPPRPIPSTSSTSIRLTSPSRSDSVNRN